MRRWLRGEAILSQEKLQGIADWPKFEPQVLRCSAGAVKAVREIILGLRWADECEDKRQN